MAPSSARVIAASRSDLRGHGESDKPHDADAYARDALVGDIVALLDHLGIARADLMGFSLGARLALATALAHPGRIDHLVLGGIGGRIFEPRQDEGAMAAAMTADDPQTIAEPMLRSFRHFADEQGEDRLALAACSQGSGRGFHARDARGRSPCRCWSWPARAMQLAGDPAELAAAIPGASTVSLPGCDHFSAIPHALFKASVFDFLDDVLDF